MKTAMQILVLLVLIQFDGINSGELWINPDKVVSVRQAEDDDGKKIEGTEIHAGDVDYVVKGSIQEVVDKLVDKIGARK
jgi:uncharacterized protein YlzI (FlbEa/FlbD family)